MSVPPGGPVEPEICLACPAERRRQLLAAPGGPDARGPPPEAADAAAEAEAPPTATLDWFLVQGLGCVGVGVGVFIITFADVAVGLCSERSREQQRLKRRYATLADASSVNARSGS